MLNIPIKDDKRWRSLGISGDLIDMLIQRGLYPKYLGTNYLKQYGVKFSPNWVRIVSGIRVVPTTSIAEGELLKLAEHQPWLHRLVEFVCGPDDRSLAWYI